MRLVLCHRGRKKEHAHGGGLILDIDHSLDHGNTGRHPPLTEQVLKEQHHNAEVKVGVDQE